MGGTCIRYSPTNSAMANMSDLKEKATLFDSLFETNRPVYFAIVSSNSTFKRVSHPFASFLDYLPSELEGKSWVDITHKEDVKDDQILTASLLDGTSDNYSIVKRYIRKGGNHENKEDWVWITLTVIAVRDSHGNISQYLKLIQPMESKNKLKLLRLKASIIQPVLIAMASVIGGIAAFLGELKELLGMSTIK